MLNLEVGYVIMNSYFKITEMEEVVEMKFETAKYTSLGLLIAGLVIGVTGAFLAEEGTFIYTLVLAVTVALLAAGILVGTIWARCPYCGKRLFINMLKWKSCPKCRHSLYGGNAKARP